MAKRTPLTFSEQDLQTLAHRFEHPDARVQQRLEVMWLISQGLTHAEAAKLAGVARATAERYVKIYRTQGPSNEVILPQGLFHKMERKTRRGGPGRLSALRHNNLEKTHERQRMGCNGGEAKNGPSGHRPRSTRD